MADGKYRGAWSRGFTLLELLVVMMIVVVAVALLYPVFSQVRERGRQAVCMSNVSQHARAILMYADDHDERLPIAWNASGLSEAGDEALYPHWWNVVEPYLKSENVLYCPDDAGYMGMRPGDPLNDRPFHTASGSSYSSFVGWLPSGDLSTIPMPRLPGGLGGLSLAAILDPTRAALSYDSWPFWHSETRDPGAVWASHGVTVNVSFMDGSVRRRTYRSMMTYLALGPNATDDTKLLALGDLPQPRLTEPGEVSAAGGPVDGLLHSPGPIARRESTVGVAGGTEAAPLSPQKGSNGPQ
jgi:prepilin-type N-terminal cleavage/methylation domain-containing protein/prepilin-type processing-associated H-X9-DG protein